MLTVAQTMHIFEILWLESRVCKKWQTLAIIQEISDSNLETGRYGLPDYPKSGVSQIIQGSGQNCNNMTCRAISLCKPHSAVSV